MSGPNHVAGGVVFTGIYLSMFDVNIYSSPLFLFFTAIFSLLPDVDHTKSLIGKPLYPIARYLDRKFGHRTITHSLLCYFFLALVIGMLERIWTGEKVITQIFLWAYGSHLVLDMLTIQGVPLLYPFKKNPCVIPGNPKFRFRSLDFKVESIAFVLFVMLAFSCKDLFANGFWNTYDKAFGTIKSVHTEQLLSDKGIQVRYNVQQNGRDYRSMGLLISSSNERLLLFNGGFLTIQHGDRIRELVPVRSGHKPTFSEIQFSGISIDSLNSMLKGKPLMQLKIQAALPISYVKDNTPQSGTSISLENVYNPVLKSLDMDSLDLATAKELSLVNLDMQQEDMRQNLYLSERRKALETFSKVQSGLTSEDLAEREKATKAFEAAKRSLESIQPPLDNRPALQVRLNFLRSKLHIRRAQSIDGYIQFLNLK